MLIGLRSLLALDSKLPGGHCLTHIGREGISRITFKPNADERDKRIRESVGILNRKIKAHTGRQAENIAILSTRKKGVEIISRALTGNGGVAPIPHFVFVDEASVLLASRLIAFLLEPKEPNRDLAYLAEGFELVAAVFRAKGGKTHLSKAQKSQECAEQARWGKLTPRLKTAGELLNVLKKLAGQPFTGDPRVDWLQARKHLEDSASSDLRELAADAGQLRAFNRGQRIAEGSSKPGRLGVRTCERGRSLMLRLRRSNSSTGRSTPAELT